MTLQLTPVQFEAALRDIGAKHYHNLHPFHGLLHAGKLAKPQVQAFRDWLIAEVAQFKQEVVWPEGGEPLQYQPRITTTPL